MRNKLNIKPFSPCGEYGRGDVEQLLKKINEDIEDIIDSVVFDDNHYNKEWPNFEIKLQDLNLMKIIIKEKLKNG
jgi:hypothetical protein